MQKILIAEDDADINHLLMRILTQNHYQTIQAYSGTETKLLLGMEKPDLLILDLMLPGMSGEALVVWMREEMQMDIPILVISAKTALEKRVALLKDGADDYLTKPFEADEVLARVYALLRRSKKPDPVGEPAREVCTYKKLSLYLESRKVLLEHTELSLTMHEFDILYLMMQSPEKVFSREFLYEQVWKSGYYGEDNTVNVHVSNLRKKIAAVEPETEYIKTIWGIGFKMA